MMINQMLQIKYPIFQGAMANIATARFAADVSNSGALGILGTGAMNAAQVAESIDEIRTLTDKPFGVNVMLMNPDADAIMQVIAEKKVPVVTTGAGNPGKYMEMLKASGTKVFPVVASVALAIRMERAGADGIIAEGTEAGGHVNEQTTMALIPQVVDAVNIPVIAAGGVATLEDIKALYPLSVSANLEGAISGRAIYEGTLDLREAMAWIDRQRTEA